MKLSNSLKQVASTANDLTHNDLDDLVLKLRKEEQVECPLKETWDKDTMTYTREVFIPKGTMAIGFKHKVSCVNIVARGELLIREGMDGKPTHVKVPRTKTHMFITEPGTQKIVYAIEDTIVINIFTNVPVDCSYDKMMESIIYPIEGVEPPRAIGEGNKGDLLWHS